MLDYRAHFAAVGRLNDELIGISYGLPPSDRLGQEITNTVVGFEVPNFNLGAGSYAVMMRHAPDERRVAKSTAAWTAAREALIVDPDADVAKILAEPHAPVEAIESAPAGGFAARIRWRAACRRRDAGQQLGIAGGEPLFQILEMRRIADPRRDARPGGLMASPPGLPFQRKNPMPRQHSIKSN